MSVKKIHRMEMKVLKLKIFDLLQIYRLALWEQKRTKYRSPLNPGDAENLESNLLKHSHGPPFPVTCRTVLFTGVLTCPFEKCKEIATS